MSVKKNQTVALCDRVQAWAEEWPTVQDAADSIGKDKSTLYRWISGEQETPILMKRLLDAEFLLNSERASHAATKRQLRLEIASKKDLEVCQENPNQMDLFDK